MQTDTNLNESLDYIRTIADEARFLCEVHLHMNIVGWATGIDVPPGTDMLDIINKYRAAGIITN